MDGERLQPILSRLREGGGRLTTARRAVITALVGAHGHVTADDLVARVQQAHPEAHRSTVYRTLDALERLGVVDHVHLGHGRAVYHLADEPHQHLVCESCGEVVEVSDEIFDDLARTLHKSHGFTIRPHHFAVLGKCRACG
ncbi:MAG: Fur family transcriptional regulator [Acidimicrobiales bacterium]